VSLRAILTVTMAVLTALAVAAAASLVVSARYFHRAAVGLADAVESVRLAEAVEVDLLTHGHRRGRVEAVPPVSLGALESRLRQNVAQMYRFSGSPEETDLIRAMETRMDAYLAAADRARDAAPGTVGARVLDAEMGAALDAVDRVVEINVRQAREVQDRAAVWDRWARTFGSVVALALVAGLTAVLLWVRGRAFRPMFQIADAMRRFGAGERTARAREAGPAELLEVARTFNQMATALERQREAQLAFLAGIGHDLLNPLSAVRLNVALVAPDRPLPRESDVRAVFERLERQVEKLRRMISDLLDAARVETGQLSLELQPCELKDLVEEVVEHYRQAAPGHPIALSVPHKPVAVRCDPLRIEQVLSNLVGNAIKYSPNGTPVEVAVTHDAGRATVTVTDQGVGVAPEDRPHLFEPFRRGSRARGIAGLGLGLAVARRIVEAHGGRIELDSAPTAGSIFHLILPSAGGPPA